MPTGDGGGEPVDLIDGSPPRKRAHMDETDLMSVSALFFTLATLLQERADEKAFLRADLQNIRAEAEASTAESTSLKTTLLVDADNLGMIKLIEDAITKEISTPST